MGQYEAKTKPTARAVSDFIAAVENPVRREDAKTVDAMMRRVTGNSRACGGRR